MEKCTSKNLAISCVSLLTVAFALFYLVSQTRITSFHPRDDLPNGGEVCNREFIAYRPSQYEVLWYDNIESWKTTVCEKMKTQPEQVETWSRLSGTKPLPHESLPTDVFSSFVFWDSCTKSEKIVYIEPLAGLTRHPRFCLGTVSIVDKGYLLVDGATYVAGSRAFYFDLGASTWSTGAGGASQEWFHSVYGSCGVNFSAYFAWEAAVINPQDVFNQIPTDVWERYHWYNIPANPDPNFIGNPLNLIRRVVKKEDFLVLKIDIDNTPIEEKFLQQILDDKALLALIDDFFFEHHVNVKEMHSSWGTQNTLQTLADTYRIFRTLRNAGVRAHSWV